MAVCADPRVVSSIPAQSHTFVEIDHETISTVMLLLSPDVCLFVLILYIQSTIFQLCRDWSSWV